jgi:uroporphyrin-3 C-methyltransferase
MKKHKPALTQPPAAPRGGKTPASKKDVEGNAADTDAKSHSTVATSPDAAAREAAEVGMTAAGFPETTAAPAGAAGAPADETAEQAVSTTGEAKPHTPLADRDGADRGAAGEPVAPSAPSASSRATKAAAASSDAGATAQGATAAERAPDVQTAPSVTAAGAVEAIERAPGAVEDARKDDGESASPGAEPAVAEGVGQSVGEQPAGEQTTGEQTTGEQTTGEQTTGEQTTGEQTTGEQTAGEQPAGEQPAGEQPEAALQQTAAAAPLAPPPQAAPRRGGVLSLVVSLVALIGAGVLGWQVYELRQLSMDTRQEVAQRLAAGDTAVTELRALVRQQNESIASIQGRFGALEAQVSASEGMAAALESMYLEHTRSRADQVLAEVEQAINIAAQQLQLAGNFEAALIALQGAEARLALPELAHLQPLRRALIMDIDALKAHPQVDVSGLALRLEILLERIDGLPLAFEVALAQAAAEREQLLNGHERGEVGPFRLSLEYARALALDVWNEVKGMVRLERLDQAEPVLLSPEQSTYLRENVKIRLLTARLALLGRDGRTYATDLAQARGWIERFFDTRDEQVQRVIADLGELAQTPIKAEQPSLSETFAALRLVQARPSGIRPSGAGAASEAGGSR